MRDQTATHQEVIYFRPKEKVSIGSLVVNGCWGTDATHGWFGGDGGGVCRSLREARNVWKDVHERSHCVGVGTLKMVWRKEAKGYCSAISVRFS